MAWTYDIALPTNKDKVRMLIGDTLESDKQFSDEEIDAMLTFYGSVSATAVGACLGLAAKYARYADKWVGDLKILASQKSEAYMKLAEQLRESGSAIAGGGAVGIFAGGIRISQKEILDGDEDRVVPFFRRGSMDNEE